LPKISHILNNELWKPPLAQTGHQKLQACSIRLPMVHFARNNEPLTCDDVRFLQNGEQTFQAFRPVDAATIYAAMPREDSQGEAIRNRALYLLEQVTGRELTPEREAERDYAWYQVVNDQAIQAFTHNEMFVHQFYPTTDVELMGYPMTPLDACIAAVTTHMNITTHNKLYFQNGRAARGMVVFQSDDVDQAVIDAIRQHFQASANSVSASFRVPVIAVGANDKVMWQPIEAQGGRDMEFQYLSDSNARSILTSFMMSPEELPGMAHLSRGSNSMTLSECLHPDSKIFTKDNGYSSISSVLKAANSVDSEVWTGKEWQKARIFKTDIKKQVKTKLNNGTQIITSPDHKFMVVGETGPLWKVQSELNPGDFVLTNKIPVQGTSAPSFRGTEITPDFAEYLGWLTGDGNINIVRNKNTKNIKNITFKTFYHHEKEVDIWEKHAVLLRSMGLSVKQVKREVSAEEADAMRLRKGVKNVAPYRITNSLYCTELGRWLLDLGFTSSTEGKTIPPSVYIWPLELRYAFLRGFFSADGTLNKGTPRIVIHNDRLREQTKHLLMSVGVRTQLSEGTRVLDFGYGTRKRTSVPGKTTLTVKDKHEFFAKIGFLQAHKQPTQKMLSRSARWEKLPRQTQKFLIANLLKGDITKLSSSDRVNAHTVLNDKVNRSISVDKIKKLYGKVGIPVPSWLETFYCESICEIEILKDSIQMLDVEIFNDEHAFMAEGVIVHNSSNEYQLIAARDTGLRPLIGHFQTFINEKILPLLDPTLAKICTLKFYGLDSDSAEKESTRLQEDMPLHGTYDEMLERVEKDPIGREWGGEFPFNASYQQILFQHFTVGEIKAHFFGRPEALKDPALAYIRDPMWFQWQEFQMQVQQMQAQQQQMQAQAQAQQAQPGQQAQGQPADPQAQGQEQQQEQEQPAEDSAGGDAQQMEQELSKAESQLEPAQRRVLQQHKRTVKNVMASWKKEARSALNKIVAETKKV